MSAVCPLVLVLQIAASQAGSPVYERSASIGPIRLSHSDLLGLLSRVKTVVGPPQSRESVRLRLESRSGSVTISEWPSLVALASVPDVSNQVVFTLQRPDSPVSEIVLRLGDFSRTLQVSGTSSGSVDAVSRLVLGDLEPRAVWLGGADVRNWLFLPFLMALGVGAVASMWSLAERKWKLAPWFWAGELFLVLLLVIPRWDEILPGTALYRGSPSFLTRHTAEISCAGVILTIAFGVFSVWQYRRRKKAGRNPLQTP
jgi:hypothetical protein